ncbi:MAG: hypothetical protein ACI8XM_002243 [Haloarculaceae archaeon]|jgi:hypothetical protein
MSITDRFPFDGLDSEQSLPRLFYVVVLIPMLLGASHHVDHIIRGNHVGWPISPEVNPFTYSLGVYPLFAVGLYLTVRGRAGARFWTAFFVFSAAMLSYFHISPWAIEPPHHVIGPYASPLAGYVAFLVLLALIASVTIGAGWAALVWRRKHA